MKLRKIILLHLKTSNFSDNKCLKFCYGISVPPVVFFCLKSNTLIIPNQYLRSRVRKYCVWCESRSLVEKMKVLPPKPAAWGEEGNWHMKCGMRGSTVGAGEMRVHGFTQKNSRKVFKTSIFDLKRSWTASLVLIEVKSLILYFCSCFLTSESSLLGRLFRLLYLCVSLLLLLKRTVFTLSFFWYVPSPWSWSWKRVGNSKQKTMNIYENRMFFKEYIKICETAAPMWNKWPEQRLVDL